MHPSGTCIQVCFGAKFRIVVPCYPNAPFSVVFTESMQRLHVAPALNPIALMTGLSKKRRTRRKKQSERETFFFETFCRFLAH
jgi:hypothetical protein